MKRRLVLAWVDNTGFEFTGGYRDRYNYHRATRVVPEAKAAMWGDNTKALLDRLKDHIARESSCHEWMGYFVLEPTDDVLPRAREMALKRHQLSK